MIAMVGASKILRTIAAVAVISASTASAAGGKPSSPRPVSYRRANVDGLNIFYREAGPRDAPTLLLLHGLPS